MGERTCLPGEAPRRLTLSWKWRGRTFQSHRPTKWARSNGTAAASGNLETWKSRNLEILDLEIQKFGDLGTWKSRRLRSKKSEKKISKSKSVLPKMSARSGLVGNKSSWPYLGPSKAILSKDQKNQKTIKNADFLWWANGPDSPGLGPCCYPPEVGQ